MTRGNGMAMLISSEAMTLPDHKRASQIISVHCRDGITQTIKKIKNYMIKNDCVK